MAKPKTKIELLDRSMENFEKLNDLIESLPQDLQNKEFPKGTMNRNIRDVLAHLHHWHKMFLEWYKVGMSGEKPAMPAKDYSWKETPALNKWIQEEYQIVDLATVKKLFKESYIEVQKIIEHHTDTELFEKKRYHWTGSTSLGVYLIGATSAHYAWALKLIKKATK